MQEDKEIKSTQPHLKALAYWLFFCCASVFCMIIVGAITRLSESGLSIVEWKPLIGAIPPLNEAEWNRIFDLYKGSPEFKLNNSWMALSDFKEIFFWEWFHRLWGRMIGVFYALPFLFFLIRGWIPAGYKLKLIGLFFLGGAQGFMGWYMVKSGLVDMPAVSHYRLAAHLLLAIIIYGFMLWLALSFYKKHKGIESNPDAALSFHGFITLFSLIITILWGAFTAGLDAGLVYNDTFPKMGSNWIPDEIWFYKPLWLNFFENHAGVQFVHRWLAMATFMIVLSFALHSIKKERCEFCFPMIGAFVFIQFGLGILTLLSGVSLPIAVAHQGGAIILLTLLICSLHTVRFKQP